MPKYQFECASCGPFYKILPMTNPTECPCIQCKVKSPRVLEQVAGFAFAHGSTPGNSGVSKHDYPTADNAVGHSAEQRWQHYNARSQVKDEVRARAKTHKLSRSDAKGFVNYTSMTEAQGKARSQLAKEALQRLSESKK